MFGGFRRNSYLCGDIENYNKGEIYENSCF